MDLGAFTAVADAAVDVGSAQTYNAVIPTFTVAGSPMNVFLAGFFLEDVAVSMYQSLIPDIVSRELTIALTGRHSFPTSIRTLLRTRDCVWDCLRESYYCCDW